MEILRSNLDFWLLKQFSVFLRKSVNIITSLNNLHAVKYVDKGIIRLCESISFRFFLYNVNVSLRFRVSCVRGTYFLAAVS